MRKELDQMREDNLALKKRLEELETTVEDSPEKGSEGAMDQGSIRKMVEEQVKEEINKKGQSLGITTPTAHRRALRTDEVQDKVNEFRNSMETIQAHIFR